MVRDCGVIEDVLLDFANRLPEGDREEHLERIKHCLMFGNLLILNDWGVITGYAELYKMKAPPSHPAWPLPVSDPNGRYLYCFAAVCNKRQIRRLMRQARYTFPDCEWLCWHRFKKNNKLKIIPMEAV